MVPSFHTVMTCPSPPPLNQADISYRNSFVGSIAMYKCQAPYEFESGSSVRTIICKLNLKWTLEELDDCVGQPDLYALDQDMVR